jgi:hypothetical protein
VTAATPISVGVTWAATALAVSIIVWPAAVVTGIGALTFATISGYRMRKSSLDMERQELINSLNAEADKYKVSFVAAAEAQGQLIIDNVLD